MTVRCVTLARVSVDRRYVFTPLRQEKARSADVADVDGGADIMKQCKTYKSTKLLRLHRQSEHTRQN